MSAPPETPRDITASELHASMKIDLLIQALIGDQPFMMETRDDMALFLVLCPLPSDAQLEAARELIDTALGSNNRLMVAFVDPVRTVGPLKEDPEVGVDAHRKAMQAVFRRFSEA